MATIYEVSKLAGVSLATVSRVINGNEKVRAKTRDKVMAAVNELNYRPNSVAKSLASNRTDSVGVLVSELHGPIFGSMMSEIETTLRKSGKHVVFTAGHSDEQSERDGIDFLLNRNCDALILHVEALEDAELIEIYNKSKAPIIFINRLVPELSEDCIHLNNYNGGLLAANALLTSGHTNIAYISGPKWKDDASNRLKGLQDAMSAAGLQFDEGLLFEGDYHEDSGYVGMKHLLNQGKKITSLACANDEMAAGAMRAIREAGMSIPNDISVIGYDNIIFSRFMNPRLSTIHYPIDEMGKMAVELIMHRRYGMAAPSKTIHKFDPSLIERESIVKN